MVKSQKTDQVGGETDRSDQELCQPPPTTTNNRRKSVIVAQAITITNREQPQPTTTTYQGAVHLLLKGSCTYYVITDRGGGPSK